MDDGAGRKSPPGRKNGTAARVVNELMLIITRAYGMGTSMMV